MEPFDVGDDAEPVVAVAGAAAMVSAGAHVSRRLAGRGRLLRAMSERARGRVPVTASAPGAIGTAYPGPWLPANADRDPYEPPWG
ncbi:hypothetical protein I6A84_17920, partial [Frankia sp. CNm7]|nr:hypothetical protein [Frankia nepalensis]